MSRRYPNGETYLRKAQILLYEKDSITEGTS